MQLHPRFGEHIPAERTALRQPQQTIVRGTCVRALGQVESSNAEILLIVSIPLERQPKSVSLRERVIDASIEVHAIRWPTHIRADRAVRSGSIDVCRVVEGRPARRQRERRALLDQRATQIESVLLCLLWPLLVHERVPRVEHIVAKREVEPTAQRPHAGLRGDIDEDHAAAVVLCSKHVAGESN